MKCSRAVVAIFILLVVPLAEAQSQSWNRQIKGKHRFRVLKQFNGEAVWDRETGLVWETDPFVNDSWSGALSVSCINRDIGGRKGWRLPTIEELNTLVDPTQSNPALPANHPFVAISGFYWAATSGYSSSAAAYTANLDVGENALFSKTDTHGVWCVRGGTSSGVHIP